MIRITADFTLTDRSEGISREKRMIFSTNDSGNYLFKNIFESSQISRGRGFDNPKKMKKAIREHIKYEYGAFYIISRIKYSY